MCIRYRQRASMGLLHTEYVAVKIGSSVGGVFGRAFVEAIEAGCAEMLQRIVPCGSCAPHDTCSPVIVISLRCYHPTAAERSHSINGSV